MASPIPPDGPWSSPSFPRYTIHPIPIPVLKALEAGDLDKASFFAPASLPQLTPFLISASNRGIWRRRLELVTADPSNIPWLTRLIVYTPESVLEIQDRGIQATRENSSIIVGRIGYHRKPDERGIVELGYEIDPAHMRKGHGTTAMRIMIDIARSIPGVNFLKASIAPENWISRRIVEREGLRKVGTETHERRGIEDKFEMDVS